ncbi:FtsH protease activity modulator HflK [Candidatus Parabeggiatoa sp. HSG14]|uniref:FtsH protease activity modulator HflK n=1 Tax=Candidatus Parabeggiatoa sp. HSG14 TaxID=3055593 RepID=UPI0025A7B0B0|nr:FtsH protease activity modulator HflK [Thiotrichales bacterium HSG14]
MAWNEPGGNGSKDPWGHRKKEQGPPDLDEIVQKMQDKLGGLFGSEDNGRKGGGKGEGGGNNSGGNNNEESLSWFTIGILAAILLSIWGAFGFYTIQPAELGVVTQFGRYSETTEQGLNWHWPYPIEQVQKVNVEKVRAVTHKALMLTKDENIVDIELVVQYRVIDAKNYLFNVYDPDNTLHQATESALREVVGTSGMDAVLTSERTRVAADTKVLIQTIVDRYKTGLKVASVNMQNAQPPEAVQAAFADVIKAREDEVRSKNKAQAYENQIVERAKGIADRLREEALAYKAQVIARAEGETKRFLSILKEYEKAPEITRQRLYLESMESVYSKASKVMIDIQGGNNLMVLPLDRIFGNAARASESELSKALSRLPQATSTSPKDNRQDNARSRGGR